MNASYIMHSSDLDINFIESVKKLFKSRTVRITITSDDPTMDETDYLLSHPANASHLRNAIANIENHPASLIAKDLDTFGLQ